MPTYRVETPNGNFKIESPNELQDAEIQQLVSQQQPAAGPNPFAGEESPTPSGGGYFERVGRRVGEAGEAALGIPGAAWDTLTGGAKGRLEAGLRLLRGIGSPVEVLTSPIEGAVEYAATPYMSEEAARTAGSVSAIPFTLGVGLLAKAGKLTTHGQQLAKVLGVGATDAIDQFRRDPQLRYAAQLPPQNPAEPILEQLSRTSATAEELAMAVKSPVTAEAILKKYKAQGDLWRQQLAENGFALGDVPASPVLDHNQVMLFEVSKPYDLGLLGTLGTPTAQAARVHPLGAKVAFDMAEAEMKLRRSIESRELRNQRAIGAVGDKTVADAVKLRNVKELDEILASNAAPDVKATAQFLQNKFDADRGILIPRLRDQEASRIRAALEKAESLKPESSRMSPAELDRAVQTRTEKLIPQSASIDDLLTRVFPTYYRIMDKKGNFLESANNKAEAMMKIKDLADAGGLKAGDFKTSHRAIFDADTLRIFQGRVARHFEHYAKDLGLTPAEVEGAIRGDFSLHAPSKFFNEFLGMGHKGMTKDVMNALNFYDRTVEKWLHINDIERTAKPALRELQDRGYRRLSDMLYTSLNALKGHRSAIGEYVDNSLAGIPGVNQLVAPYFLERWTTLARGGIVNAFLKYTPRFHALNATQMAQTLYPIVDSAGDIYRAGKLWASGGADELLKRHGIKGIGTRVEDFSRGLGPTENMNQQVAWLTMYDKARRLGLSDDQAAAYGRLRGNLHSQFLGLVTDVPKAFRAVDPTGMMLMFQRFPVKQMELVLDLIKSRQFPGVAKWMGVNLALGGMKAATLGQAGWLTLGAYDKIKKEFGEQAADTLHVGLPGLLGLDMSNSVMLYNPPFGDGWAEKVGNLMGGPLGSVLGNAIGAASASDAPEPEAGKRVYNALVNSLPIGRELNALAQLIEGDYDLRDPLGRLRYKASFTDMLKKVLGFRTVEEAKIDTAVSAMIEMKQRRDAIVNYAASRYGQARVAGIPLGEDMEKIVKGEVDNWNSMWPEFPITGDAIADRTKARAEAATQALRQRVLRSMPKVIRDAEQFRLPPGGG